MMAWVRRLFRRGMERAEWKPPMIYALREPDQESWEVLETRSQLIQARIDTLRAELRAMQRRQP